VYNEVATAQVAGTMAALQQLLDINPPCPEFRPLEVSMMCCLSHVMAASSQQGAHMSGTVMCCHSRIQSSCAVNQQLRLLNSAPC
jgi:hypothetical protein